MTEEYLIFEGNIPFKVAHFSHGLLWLLLFGWNIGMLISWLQTFAESITISTQRIILRHGIISKDMEEVEFYRVKDTKYQQTLLQRAVSIGTITLFSDDTTAPNLSFTIDRPEYYREQIRASVNEERKRMGAIQID